MADEIRITTCDRDGSIRTVAVTEAQTADLNEEQTRVLVALGIARDEAPADENPETSETPADGETPAVTDEEQ